MKNWYEKYKEKVHRYKSSIVDADEAREIIDSFQESVSKHDVYLYGAGTVGQNFIRLFRELRVSVCGIMDRDPSASKILNMEIKDISFARKIAEMDNAIVIVSANRTYFDEIVEDLGENGIPRDRILNGHDLHLILQSAYCLLGALEEHKRFDLTDCWECTLLDNQCFSLRTYLKRINQFKSDDGKTTDKIRMIGYILGNICSLKCKNCCECIPYFEADKRAFVPADEIIRDIQHLSSACDFLTILEFVGGEPFMHPELKDVLQRVLAMKKVGIIHVFTNGTVVPGDDLCEVMRNERIMIYISNYQSALEGERKERRNKTIEKLGAHGVTYKVGRKEDWLDYRSFDQRNYSEDELERNFADCFLNECNRLYKGTLYTCPHQYAGVNLGKLKPVDGTVRIYEYDPDQLSEELERFRSIKTLDACRYCKLPYNAEKAVSGEQV